MCNYMCFRPSGFEIMAKPLKKLESKPMARHICVVQMVVMFAACWRTWQQSQIRPSHIPRRDLSLCNLRTGGSDRHDFVQRLH
jgi:hypothetical protein